MKTTNLPEFSGHPVGALARFIFDHEPEGIRESNRFRRQLCGILNNARNEPDVHWVPNNPRKKSVSL